MDALVYVIAICLTASFGVLSAILFRARWWFWNSIIWFLVLAFLITDITQQELVPKDLPIALMSDTAVAEEQIVCHSGLANKYIIVEGDYLYCRQLLKSKTEGAGFATFLTVRASDGVKKIKQVTSGSGYSEFAFMVPKAEEFSFLLEATTDGRTVTISPADSEYSLEGWFTIRSKADATAYISELQIFVIATMLSLSGLFFTINQMRDMWQNRESEDHPDTNTLDIVRAGMNFKGVR